MEADPTTEAPLTTAGEEHALKVDTGGPQATVAEDTWHWGGILQQEVRQDTNCQKKSCPSSMTP